MIYWELGVMIGWNGAAGLDSGASKRVYTVVYLVVDAFAKVVFLVVDSCSYAWTSRLGYICYSVVRCCRNRG